MIGREYRFDFVTESDSLEVLYWMEPTPQGANILKVNWRIPRYEKRDDNGNWQGSLPEGFLEEYDEVISDACFDHYRENSGDYKNPGPKGGEQP